MKIVHTTYFITTVLFLMIAAFLLTEQPLLLKDRQKLNSSPAIQETHKPKEEPKEVKKDPFAEMPKVKVVATGYYAGVESTGKDKGHPQYGITYSGAKVVRDHYSTIAADLSVFPLGTILYIPGYGYGIVADIGSAIKGNKIDLYFDSKEDVFRKWGKKTVDVVVVKRGEGHVTDSIIADLNQKEEAVEANTQIN